MSQPRSISAEKGTFGRLAGELAVAFAWSALALTWLGALSSGNARAETLTIAAAADLKFALTEVVDAFAPGHPGDKVEVVYGSSGKLFAQLANDAPYNLFFSADMDYARNLEAKGLTVGPAQPYAIGHLVLWSRDARLAKTPLADLPKANIAKLAIANPDVAPYGRRAKEALEHAGVWAAMQPKLVMGENIAQTAQFVESGAADAGILALSLVLSPAMKDKGTYSPVPPQWHSALEQGYVVLARARDNPLAKAFSEHMRTSATRAIMRRYGFALPGEEGSSQ